MEEKEINNMILKRDKAIRELWTILNDLSYSVKLDDFTDEDLNLWSKVTEHSACQNRLGKLKTAQHLTDNKD